MFAKARKTLRHATKVLVAAMATLAFALVGCSVSPGEPDPVIGSWEGDGIVFLSSYDATAVFGEDGSVTLDLDQETHNGTGVGLGFDGTWKAVDAIPSSSMVFEDGDRAYEIDFDGTIYYGIYVPDFENSGPSLVICAFTESGEFDMTKASCTLTPVSDEEPLTADEIEAQIAEQPVTISSTEYLVQHESLKSLYPDFLMATVTNNTDTALKTVRLGFVAWDENGLPVKIYPSYGDGYYYVEMTASDANIPAGGTWAEQGVQLSGTDPLDIDTFKAIVVSYTDFEGNTWDNPLLEDWQSAYENVPL